MTDPTYASDASSLGEQTDALEAEGFEAQFAAVEDGVRCFTCGTVTAAAAITAQAVRRTEGASDPADMNFIAAVTCPACNAQGTLVMHYGAEASIEEQDVLRAIDLERNAQTGGQDV